MKLHLTLLLASALAFSSMSAIASPSPSAPSGNGEQSSSSPFNQASVPERSTDNRRTKRAERRLKRSATHGTMCFLFFCHTSRDNPYKNRSLRRRGPGHATYKDSGLLDN